VRDQRAREHDIERHAEAREAARLFAQARLPRSVSGRLLSSGHASPGSLGQTVPDEIQLVGPGMTARHRRVPVRRATPRGKAARRFEQPDARRWRQRGASRT